MSKKNSNLDNIRAAINARVTETESLPTLQNIPEVKETPDLDMDAVNAAILKALSNPDVVKSAYEKMFPSGNRTHTTKGDGNSAATFEVKPGQKDGYIDIVFSDKPDTKTRTVLKQNGFRFSPYNKCWYGPAKLMAENDTFGSAVKPYLK